MAQLTSYVVVAEYRLYRPADNPTADYAMVVAVDLSGAMFDVNTLERWKPNADWSLDRTWTPIPGKNRVLTKHRKVPSWMQRAT